MQTQIDIAGGYTFSAALRSLLRQNPNVIMVGEVRDPETAVTAVEAATTGHLLLSTVHANTAAGAAYRLASLAQSRSNVADAIELSIGQRLVRRLCQHCRVPLPADSPYLPEAMAMLKNLPASAASAAPDLSQAHFYESRGCPACNGLGYKGRLGVYEALSFSAEMRQVLARPDSIEADLIGASRYEMPSLVQDALLKALEGETSLEEVFKISG
jgi:type II secretory ATPase GspE/PulE/Tfp pilus assembly ATPase PilB-like protein